MISKISLLVSKNSTPSRPQRFNPTDRTESVSDASRQKGVILEFPLSLSFSVDRLSDFGGSTHICLGMNRARLHAPLAQS